MSTISTVNGEDNLSADKQAAVKTAWVRKTHLAEFLIKIRGADGTVTDGEFTCAWKDETVKFKDINDFIRLIEEQCDSVAYPQPQRKLRNWDSK